MGTSFDLEYKKLNSEQKKAVDTIEGPVMVVAGPGTGKTQILAMRIAQILKKTQVNPSNILCLTFTNSGVQAMKQRLLSIIGPVSYQINVHTFHSFCNEIISLFPEKFLTAKKINQISDLDQILIIQKILKENDFKYIKPLKSPYYYQKAIIGAIGNLKQENVTPEQFKKIVEKELQDFEQIEDLHHEKGQYKGQIKAKYEQLKNNLLRNQELVNTYKQYVDLLSNEGKYDYSDMILFVLDAFRNDQEILLSYQEKYQYILVDEYQDTNSAQNELIAKLAGFYEEPNVFVVGDDEQSIFRFQGASLENILSFKKSYPKAEIIVLEENYRSIQKILDASRSVISNNKNQIFNHLNIEKKLKSQLKDIEGNLELAEFSTGSIESFFVAKKVGELIKNKVAPNEIAVLYKEHRDATELIDFLSKLNIPYILEVGGNILDDPEIGKILKYLNILSFGLTKIDNGALLEVMHFPFFGIPVLDIYKITVAAKERKNIFEVITSDKILDALELSERKSVEEFVETLLVCRNTAENSTFAHAFEFIINRTGYLNYLLNLSESVHHLNRLQTLFDEIKVLNTKDRNFRLPDFLQYVDQLNENDIPIKQKELSANYEGVRLMTAHKAKGLEFEYVFIIHATDKHWGNKVKKELIKLPQSLLAIQKQRNGLSAEASAEMDEEERRLFYVALTRAKRHIFITFADSYGDESNPVLTVPSRFITEMPKILLVKTDVKKYEDSFDDRLRLSFAEKKWQPSEALSDFLQNLIHEFKLSPTALNSYLECPQRFFYDNILRVPKTKDFTQSYGTAVHKALELLFKKFKRDLKLPTKEEFIADFESALKEEIFTGEDRKRAEQRGKEILSNYYDFYTEKWQKRGAPLSCELDFSRHDVHFNDIPITGKIDRIDLIDSISNKVRIVDYKTSSPKSLNFLMGQTKEKDTKLLNQAFFYKLLCETDPLFKWKIGEIEFDFISPERNVFKKVSIPIDEKQYTEFRKVVEDVYDNIVNLKFHLEEQACQKKEGKCQYFNICHTAEGLIFKLSSFII